ncbi:MAG: ABC transporter permease [Clostridia bacterium]|nr:ABC transporter permease [Clostridia bacterium]
MIKRTLKNLKRAPVRAVAVLLFAAVITMIICALHASNEAELLHYEEAYQSIPVTVTVTGLPSENKYNFPIAAWVPDLFLGKEPLKVVDVSAAKTLEEAFGLKSKTEPTEVSLAEYVKDAQMKLSHFITEVNGNSYTNASGTCFLIGMTSLSCDKQLLPEYGCEIKWYEGYDESIFEGDELVCLIPEDMAKPRYYDNGKGEAELYFFLRTMGSTDGGPVEEKSRHEYNCTLKIAGTYTAGDEKSIYCPLPVIEQVYTALERTPLVDSFTATLADNRRIEEFREKASLFFAEPALEYSEIPCGIFVTDDSMNYYSEFYRNAIDIADENLFDLAAILEDSIKFNKTVTVFVVALSIVAGFLVGFLMIRRRKREIMLMRMVGESNARVYVGFALEQMICIILGIVIGGAYYKWNPINNLAIFAVAYFVALSLALTIFMSKKLIKNVKEDE